MVFHYADGRGGQHAETFLHGFDGILQIDGYAGYNRLTKPSRTGGAPIIMAQCWAHARRKLREIFDRDKSPIAGEGLRSIAKFYAIEDEIRGMSPADRLAVRTARSAPLVAAFGTWLKEQRARDSKKSRLGEKLTYIANHWEGLQIFLTDGRVEIDSNAVENLIRTVALSRKNALFAGHDEGGRSWGRIASLIETAKINGVEPFAYLSATLERIALVVSFQQFVHSILTELVGVTKLQHCSEGSNERSQECQIDAFGSRVACPDRRGRDGLVAGRGRLRMFRQDRRKVVAQVSARGPRRFA